MASVQRLYITDKFVVGEVESSCTYMYLLDNDIVAEPITVPTLLDATHW